MNARHIKQAFLDLSPVRVCMPNEKLIECAYIKEVIYSRSPRSGKIMVSCLLQDANCPHSVIRARGRYIKLKEDVSDETLEAS
jgi:hypothetical protein